MAKELFNSPRYEKKEIIPIYDINNDFEKIPYLIVFLIILAGILDEFFQKSFYFYPIPFLLMMGFAVIKLAYLILFNLGGLMSDKINYRLYVKNLNKQKILFHRDGTLPYILPYEELTDNFMSLKLRLFVVVMRADKEEKVLEMDKVKSYISNHEHQSNYTNRVNEFKKYLKEDFAVEDVAFAMYWLCEKEREDILKELFDLAYADGDFCDEEEYILRYIAYHMHLNEDEYERTLRNFIIEHWNGYEQYHKARYGGYWYHDKNGNRKRNASKDDDEKKTGDSSSASGSNHKTTPSISPELQKAYAVLGISVDATPSEINACKRNLLRLNHPDLVATRGQEAVYNATLKCQKINQAYELLKANGKC